MFVKSEKENLRKQQKFLSRKKIAERLLSTDNPFTQWKSSRDKMREKSFRMHDSLSFLFFSCKIPCWKLFLKRERKISRRKTGEIKSELLIAQEIDGLFCKYLYRIVCSKNHLALLLLLNGSLSTHSFNLFKEGGKLKF